MKHIIARYWARYRAKTLYKWSIESGKNQKRTLLNLIKQARNTQFGKDHEFDSINSIQDFQQKVPIRNYEELRPYIDCVVSGMPNVLWKGKPLYLAKTSGTTSGTKYIPISRASIPYHISAARDLLLFYIYHTDNTAFLDGKMSFLSGSPELERNSANIYIGRLSGISHHYVPSYLQKNRIPSHKTNCIEDWELKIDTMVEEIKNEDLRLIAGIPPWVQMFFEILYKKTGKLPSEIWPNLSIFIQGGVDFTPYKPIFLKWFGKPITVLEVYPASEGFIAIQDRPDQEGMLLLTNHGIFYEFIPLESYGTDNPTRLTLEQVEINKNYAIILSTNAGLWAYDIGDTVKFISLKPYRIKVTGRTKHFISAFGEHVIEEEVNFAMQQAVLKNDGLVNDFTVAPLITKEFSCHEWWISFEQLPTDVRGFSQSLDLSLREKNSYYDDLRTGNILQAPKIKILPPDACREYMKSIGKLGGQNKFPRLSNSRTIVEKLAPYVIELGDN